MKVFPALLLMMIARLKTPVPFVKEVNELTTN